MIRISINSLSNSLCFHFNSLTKSYLISFSFSFSSYKSYILNIFSITEISVEVVSKPTIIYLIIINKHIRYCDEIKKIWEVYF